MGDPMEKNRKHLMQNVANHPRIAAATVVFVLAVAIFLRYQHSMRAQDDNTQRMQPVYNLITCASHLTAYGEELDYDFSGLADTDDAILQTYIKDLQAAGAVYQDDVFYQYPDTFWEPYPNSYSYIMELTEYCMDGEFTDYYQLIRITKPLTDLTREESAPEDFYSELEQYLDTYSYTEDKT